MGEFAAGTWIVGLVIYFFLMFLIVQSAINVQGYYNLLEFDANVTDPGFQNKTNLYFLDDLNGQCRGKGGGRAMNFLQNIQCSQLKLDDYDFNACNNISGCYWENVTEIFGFEILPAGCSGMVNKSYYNITGGLNQYCQSSGLQEEGLCYTFKCDWIDIQTLNEEALDPLSTSSVTSLWTSIKFMATFRFDFGAGNFNWIFITLFFWLPSLMLLFSIYMALPFLH